MAKITSENNQLKTHKLVIKPWYASYALFSKVSDDDSSDWVEIANGASSKDVIKRIVLAEIDKIFEGKL